MNISFVKIVVEALHFYLFFSFYKGFYRALILFFFSPKEALFNLIFFFFFHKPYLSYGVLGGRLSHLVEEPVLIEGLPSHSIGPRDCTPINKTNHLCSPLPASK
jgi:hypothetical protein